MKLAVIEKINELLPIEGADRIELAVVQGWKAVVKKGEFEVGQMVVFIPIDTVMEPRHWNEFLWDKEDPSKPIRVKTVKLRGQVSQGLVFSVKITGTIWQVMGNDVSETLGVTKYERPIPASLQGEVRGSFPSHLISRTDEDNLLSNIKVLEELKKSDYVQVTLKMDGSSMTALKTAEGEFHVCSRNLDLKETEENSFWKAARMYNLEEQIEPGTAFQFELCGPGIQKNLIGLKELSLYLFNAKNLSSGEYFNPVFRPNESTIKSVPLVKSFTAGEILQLTTEELQELANKQKYPSGLPAEGIVIRGFDSEGKSRYSEHLQKMLSVKIINQNYKD